MFRVVANQILEKLRHVPGVVDARIQQRFDYPKLHVDVDRTRAADRIACLLAVIGQTGRIPSGASRAGDVPNAGRAL